MVTPVTINVDEPLEVNLNLEKEKESLVIKDENSNGKSSPHHDDEDIIFPESLEHNLPDNLFASPTLFSILMFHLLGIIDLHHNDIACNPMPLTRCNMQKIVEKYRTHVKKVETHIPENEVHTQVNNIFMIIEITRLFKEQVEKLKAKVCVASSNSLETNMIISFYTIFSIQERYLLEENARLCQENLSLFQKVREDPVFQREGPNIHADATLNITQVCPGTQPGQKELKREILTHMEINMYTNEGTILSECSFGAVKHGVKQGGGQFWNKKDEDLVQKKMAANVVFFWPSQKAAGSRAATRAANNTKESLESSRTNRGKIVRKNSIKERHQGSMEANKTAGSKASKHSWDNLETSLTNRGKNVRKNTAAENGTKASSRRKLDVGFMHISIVFIGNWMLICYCLLPVAENCLDFLYSLSLLLKYVVSCSFVNFFSLIRDAIFFKYWLMELTDLCAVRDRLLIVSEISDRLVSQNETIRRIKLSSAHRAVTKIEGSNSGDATATTPFYPRRSDRGGFLLLTMMCFIDITFSSCAIRIWCHSCDYVWLCMLGYYVVVWMACGCVHESSQDRLSLCDYSKTGQDWENQDRRWSL
ncbi:hypothetical protein LXL04_023343 [Taraxacum kok-saghyz]